MILNVKVTIDPLLGQLHGLGRQLPFITSLAVDKTAWDTLSKVHESIRTNPAFTLRSGHPEKVFVMRQKARKGTPTAIIGPAVEKDFWSKFEKGGFDTGQGHRLAVPLGARKTQGHVIRKDQTPRGLGAKAFTIKTKKGQTLLVTRIGKAAATKRAKKGHATKGPDPRLVIQYLLTHQVPIRPTLHFLDTANQWARQRFPFHAKAALDYAISTTKDKAQRAALGAQTPARAPRLPTWARG